MRTSDTIGELLDALQAADLQNPAKSARANIPTKSGGSFSYDYADLPTILGAIVPTLSAQRIMLLQDTVTIEGRTSIVTRLMHKSGEWIEFGPLAVPHASDAQSVGSAITYGRRYQLLAALGLAAEDDDGQQASRPRQDEGREGHSTATVSKATEGGGSSGTPPPSPPPVPSTDQSQLQTQLRELTGSASKSREIVNAIIPEGQAPYTARTIVNATAEELEYAIAAWQEEHPSLTEGSA
jgi:hypothetical protein